MPRGRRMKAAVDRRPRNADRFALRRDTVGAVTITCVHCGSTTMRKVGDPVYGVEKWACYVCFNQTRLDPDTGGLVASPWRRTTGAA